MTDKAPSIHPDHSEVIDALVANLGPGFGGRLSRSAAVRAQHGNTLTWGVYEPPDLVVFPISTDDVATVVRLAAARRLPIIAHGAGTSLEGQLNAPQGGFCIDLSGMKRIVAVNPEDLDCTVEAGVTRTELNRHLRDQ